MASCQLACRILFVMPSWTATLSDSSYFIISLTSSRVGFLLRAGSEMCESEGCGMLRVCVTQSASFSSPRRNRVILKIESQAQRYLC